MAEERKEIEEKKLEETTGGLIMKGTWGYASFYDGTRIAYYADSQITEDNRYSMVGKDVVIIGHGNNTSLAIAHVTSTSERHEFLWMTTAVFHCNVLKGELHDNPIDLNFYDVFTQYEIL